MMLTHGPYQATPDSPDWDPQAKGEKDAVHPKHFGEMITYMDKLIGQLVAKLDELEIRDNTLVIFLADNGTGKGTTSQWKGQTYPGGKGSTTARGMHVSLIANWPGHVPAGKVNDDLIDSTDFYPTLCEVAGLKAPTSESFDGHSFAPQLMGEKGKPRDWIYCWFASQGGPKADREFAMTKSVKLYRDGQVFDLREDPFEEHPARAKDLEQAEAANSLTMLQGVLDDYSDARPEKLLASAPENPKKNKSPAQRAARRQRRAARNQAE